MMKWLIAALKIDCICWPQSIVCCRQKVQHWLNMTATNIFLKDFHCFLITRLIRLVPLLITSIFVIFYYIFLSF